MTRREREVTDPNEILKILDTCKIVHVGLVDDGQPYVLPMCYGYTMDDGELTLYLHGATTGYKLDVIRANPTACFEMECDVVPFEGEVACQYGICYSSIIGKGTGNHHRCGGEKTGAFYYHENTDRKRFHLRRADGFHRKCHRNSCVRLYCQAPPASGRSSQINKALQFFILIDNIDSHTHQH